MVVLCEPPMKQTAVSDGTEENRNECLVVGKERRQLSACCCRLVREGLGMKWQAVNSLKYSSCLSVKACNVYVTGGVHCVQLCVADEQWKPTQRAQLRHNNT